MTTQTMFTGIVRRTVLWHGNGKEMVQFHIDSNDEIICKLVVIERPSELRIVSLITNPGHQHQGLATSLMSVTIDYYQNHDKPIYIEADAFGLDGCDTICASLDDAQLKRFYGKFGFKSVLGHPFAMARFPVAKEPSIINN